MRTLFIHQSFPAQYRPLAAALAARPGEEVVGLFADAKALGFFAGVLVD